jgi:hypothetical protein
MSRSDIGTLSVCSSVRFSFFLNDSQTQKSDERGIKSAYANLQKLEQLATTPQNNPKKDKVNVYKYLAESRRADYFEM